MVKRLLPLLFLLTLGPVSAQSPQERVASASLLWSGDLFQVQGILSVADQGGEAFQRTLLFRFQRRSSEASLLVTVEAPAFLRNLKFLRKDTGGRSQAWVKTSRSVRVLSTNSSPEPLFGSDFTSADFAFGNRTWAAGPSAPEGLTVLVNSAPDGSQTLFLREDNLVVRSEFRTSQGALWKLYEVLEWASPGQGRLPNPRVVRMTDLNRGSSSTLTLSSLEEGQSFPSGTFTPGGL